MATGGRKFDPALLDPLVDSLAANPTKENVDIVAKQMKSLLLGPPSLSENELKKLAKHILHERCIFDEKLHPLIARLIHRLKDITIEGSRGDKSHRIQMHSVFSHAAECCYTNEPASTVLHRFKLVNEMLKLKLVKVIIFFGYARHYAEKCTSDQFVPIIYEILRNYDTLIAEGVVEAKTVSSECSQYVCYLAAIFKLSGPIFDSKLSEIDNYLTAKSFECGHTHSTKCENVLDLPAPKRLTGTRPPVPTLQSTVDLLRSLKENPDNFASIAGEIWNNLLRSKEDTLPSHVAKILDTISHKKPISPPFRKFLKTLPQRMPEGAFEKSLKLWVRETFAPINSHAVDKIWFHNELCLDGLLPFNFVLNNLISGGFPKDKHESRFCLMYRLLGSFDRLLDQGQHFDAATRKACVLATALLTNAVRDKPSLSCAPAVSLFSQLLDQKGGWCRQPKCPVQTGPDSIVIDNSMPNSQANQSEPSTNIVEIESPPLEPPDASDVLDVSSTPSPKAQDTDSSNQPIIAVDNSQMVVPCDEGNQPSAVIEPSTNIGEIDKRSPIPSITPLPQLPQPGTSQEPGLFSLSGDIDLSIDNLKQYLEFQPPRIFTERVAEILDKMFGQVRSDEMLEAASRLCLGLAKVTSNCDKSFIMEMQENCLNWFSEAYSTKVENMLSNIQHEIEAASSVEETAILAERLEFAMRSYYKKTTECPRLIAKLFSSGVLSVSFVISFLNVLIATKSEVVYRKAFEMLVEIGRDLQKQANVRNLGERFDNIFQELAGFFNGEVLSDDLKQVIEQILTLKQDGWIVLSPEQRAVSKLNSMLAKADRDPHVFDSIKTHLRACPNEMCLSFYEILVSKLEEYAINRQLQVEFSGNPVDSRKRPASPAFNDHAKSSKQC